MVMEQANMDIGFVTMDLRPFTGQGQPAVFSDALSRALVDRGHRVAVFVPDGPVWKRDDTPGVTFGPLSAVSYSLRGQRREATLRSCRIDASGIQLYLIGLPEAESESPTESTLRGFEFCLAILLSAPKLDWVPEVFHLNGPDAAWVATLLRESDEVQSLFGQLGKDVGTVFSFHQLQEQGLSSQDALQGYDLPPELFAPFGALEFFSQTNALKAGLFFSDRVCTTSPTYCKDLLEHRADGCGLEGVLADRSRDFSGVLYGIDDSWSPLSDSLLPYSYGPDDQHIGRANNKIRLLESVELPVEPKVPLLTMLSPLCGSQGLGLLQTVAGDLVGQRLKLALLSGGDSEWSEFADRLAASFPDKVASLREVPAPLFRLALAGSDFLLELPREESCGQRVQRALRYGAVPIVTPTGGMLDIVRPYSLETAKGEGFVLESFTGADLLVQVGKGLQAYGKRIAWKKLVSGNMNMDHSWRLRAEEYEKIYLSVRDRRR